MQIGGATRVFALLGDPVAHSLSPVMHNAGFRLLGLDAVYVALRCEAGAVPALMETLARQGGGGNVTIPHKEIAGATVAGSNNSPGPCNTFWGRNGRLEGAETDSAGIRSALDLLGRPEGDWCLIGTGGSARAALAAARQSGAGIAIRSRTPGRSERFAELVHSEGLSLVEPAVCRVVINCTPLGLSAGDPQPIAPAEVPAAELALDLVYRRGETAWVQAMRAAGCRAADGRHVLVEQGALAFEHWFPGRVAPRAIMRAAVRAALG
jgi:shikimate dehydrogenase